MFELVDSINDAPVIKLVGVGGGGSNAVQHMVQSGIEGVDFICANTDAQALKGCLLYTSPSPRDATLSRMPSSA